MAGQNRSSLLLVCCMYLSLPFALVAYAHHLLLVVRCTCLSFAFALVACAHHLALLSSVSSQGEGGNSSVRNNFLAQHGN